MCWKAPSFALVLLFGASASFGGEVKIVSGPTAAKTEGKTRIAFAVSGRTDVEVSILDAKGKVVRHLAAGVLGGEKPPEAPLKAGLSQKVTWDGKDNFGKPAKGAPFKVRLRAGMGVKFGRMIGGNPMSMGKIRGVATDSRGNAYLMSISRGTGNFKQVVQLDADGNYVKTVLPFAANLPLERLSSWARAGKDGKVIPRNRNGLGPEFYTGSVLTMLETADKKGLLFTNGSSVFRVALDGGSVDGKFAHGQLWPNRKARLPNTGKGPTHLKSSPGGKYLYLSGPHSTSTRYGHKADPRFPPGQIYRMEVGKGSMQPFAKIKTSGSSNGSWNNSHTRHLSHFTIAHGPIHDIAIDAKGNVLVADRDNQCIQGFDVAGKAIGKIPLGYPDLLAVNARTGHIYVMTKEIVGYWKYKKKLLKYSGLKNPKVLAELDLGVTKEATPRMSLAQGKEKIVLWISGMRGGLVQVEDRGKELVIVEKKLGSGFKLGNCDKLAIDQQTDTVYVCNAWTTYHRFDGKSGKHLGRVLLDKQGVTDMTVSPDGHIFAQIGKGYSGPLGRWDRDLKPAPYKQTGTHMLSKYIYGRYHGDGGFCEKGIGASRDGKVYIYWMFGGWVRYALSAWGPDGKPINGKMAPVDPNHAKAGVPAGLTNSVVGPLPGAGGGVQVDSRGRIYIGVGSLPLDFKFPADYEKDKAYYCLTGSVVRFGPDGGAMGAIKAKAQTAVRKKGAPRAKKSEKPKMFFQPGPKPKGALEVKDGYYYVGADNIYQGLAPMSGMHTNRRGWFGNVNWCHCRVPRFEVDMHDRVVMPNAISNSVTIRDSAGNVIITFGAYGNFESQGPGEKSPIKKPNIPLGWPTGAGSSDAHIYVGDMLNRRVVRADKTWAAETTCDLK
jgi:NHL repeat